MNSLIKTVAPRKKRPGRGIGSGKGGHTVGRGQKGQKVRGKINIIFEGVKVKKSFIKRLPVRRGKDKFKAGAKPLIVKIAYLNILPAGTKIDLETLIKGGIVNSEDARKFGVKILGDGELTKKFSIAVPISKSAAKKIIKAGGKVIAG